MKYVYAGYCKTGTKSIGKAFKKLGYKVYDFEESMMFHRNQWLEFLNSQTSKERQYQLLYEMYKDVDVICDLPGFFFWKEIGEVFPDCKFIFYERPDVDKWFKSWVKQNEAANQIMKGPDIVRKILAAIFLPTFNELGKYSDHMYYLLFNDPIRPRNSITKGFFKTPETISKINYRKHNTDFLTNHDPDRTLIIQPGEFGKWKPLCKFIGESVPDFEFPHENKGGDIVRATMDGQGSMEGDDEMNFRNTLKQELIQRILMVVVFLLVAVILWKNYTKF